MKSFLSYVIAAALLSGPVLAADPPPSVSGDAPQLAERALLYRRLIALSLGPITLQEIVPPLSKLEKTEAEFQAKKVITYQPPAPSLERINKALMALKVPDPADQEQVDRVEASIKAEATELERLRRETTTLVRRVLSREQVDAIRVDAGMPSLRNSSYAAAAAEAEVEMGKLLQGDPTLSNPGANPELAIADALDQMYKASNPSDAAPPPDVDLQESSRNKIIGWARASGIDRGSQSFARAGNNILGLISSIRHRTVPEYGINRAPTAHAIVLELARARYPAMMYTLDAMQVSDDELAIRQLLCRPGVAAFLRTRLDH